ncbi:unnamed protein product [Linum tenue]|uniref:Peptide N-acetyl-beta-D-glucosaminyl asparaginase amidase A N-terminal domain-containing protein n=1 Tax=Linum tenue TaxID=586396 RepID=A0AAV0KKE1_9ROSI|nr:unnamed protein product [Linum tenue]
MAGFSPLLFLLFLISCPYNSIANPNLHSLNPRHVLSKLSADNPLKQSPKPKTGFQVTKPIDVPNTVPCKQLLLQHEFGSTGHRQGGNPSVVVDYALPSRCASTAFSKIVMEWKGACNQTREDTVFGVWLGGVELLRSSPAQGFNTSVAWTARKDITRYSSLLLKKQTQKLAVSFRNSGRNFLDFTSVYHVTISISYYPLQHKQSHRVPNKFSLGFGSESSMADLILPISRNLESKNGLWFQIENSTDAKLKEFRIPQNAYRAVLEVYVSSHDVDKFWYSNYPSEYYNSNQFVDLYANGPFRDVVIRLDDVVVGSIWPYPVIYGASDSIWNPIASIRSFDLPSYDVELTPFLGTLLDGGVHNLSFGIGNAASVWYVDANLHLWLDRKSSKTKGELVSSYSQPLDLSSTVKMEGLIGESWVGAQRMISSQGWVNSSHGNVTTHVKQNLSYTNYMDIGFDSRGNYSVTVEQLILSNDSVSSFVTNSVNDHYDDDHNYSLESMKNFSLTTSDGLVLVGGDGNFVRMNNFSTGYSDEKTSYENSSSKSKASSLKDEQSGSSVWVVNNYKRLDPLQVMKQSYSYQNVDYNGKVCYSRDIGSLNATIVYDKEAGRC